MNSEFYIEILQNHIPVIDGMLEDDWRIWSIAPKKSWTGPVLKPIENLWAIVKGKVERHVQKSLNELERFMAEKWRNIPEAVIINLMGLMNELVIENNGERIY